MQTGRGRGHRGFPPALARYLGQRPHAVQLEQTPERAPEETGPRRPRPWRLRRDSDRTRGEGRLDAETRFGRWTLSAREGKASAGQPVVGRLLPRAHQQREMLQPLTGRPDTKSRPDWCGKAPLQKWRGADQERSPQGLATNSEAEARRTLAPELLPPGRGWIGPSRPAVSVAVHRCTAPLTAWLLGSGLLDPDLGHAVTFPSTSAELPPSAAPPLITVSTSRATASRSRRTAAAAALGL